MELHTQELLFKIQKLLDLLNANKLNWKKINPIANLMISDTILRYIYENIIKTINENSSNIDNLKPEQGLEYEKKNSYIYQAFPLTAYTGCAASAIQDNSQRTYIIYMNRNRELLVYCLTQSKFPDGHKLENKVRRKGSFKTFKTLINVCSFEIKGILAIREPNENLLQEFNAEINVNNYVYLQDHLNFSNFEKIQTINRSKKLRVIVDPIQYDLYTLIKNNNVPIDNELRKEIPIGSLQIQKWRLMSMYQLLRAISVLHELKICHRDLKPENVLINLNNSIKLIITDFGFATRFGYEVVFNGTLKYMPPEVWIFSSKLDKIKVSEHYETINNFSNHLAMKSNKKTMQEKYDLYKEIQDIYEVKKIKAAIANNDLKIPKVEDCNSGAHDIYSLGIIFIKLLGSNVEMFMNNNIKVDNDLIKLIKSMLAPASLRIKISKATKEFCQILLKNNANDCMNNDENLVCMPKEIEYIATDKLQECIQYCHMLCLNQEHNQKISSSTLTYSFFNCFGAERKIKSSDVHLFNPYVCNWLDNCYKMFNQFTEKTLYMEFSIHLQNISSLEYEQLMIYRKNLISWQEKLQKKFSNNTEIAEDLWIDVIVGRIFAYVLTELVNMKLATDKVDYILVETIYKNLLQNIQNLTIPEAHKIMSYTQRFGVNI